MKPEVKAALAEVEEKYSIKVRSFGPGERDLAVLRETVEIAKSRAKVKARPTTPIKSGAAELTEEIVRMVPGGRLD